MTFEIVIHELKERNDDKWCGQMLRHPYTKHVKLHFSATVMLSTKGCCICTTTSLHCTSAQQPWLSCTYKGYMHDSIVKGSALTYAVDNWHWMLHHQSLYIPRIILSAFLLQLSQEMQEWWAFATVGVWSLIYKSFSRSCVEKQTHVN